HRRKPAGGACSRRRGCARRRGDRSGIDRSTAEPAWLAGISTTSHRGPGGTRGCTSMGGSVVNAVAVTVNGRSYSELVEPRLLLSDFLRHTLGLTGTH